MDEKIFQKSFLQRVIPLSSELHYLTHFVLNYLPKDLSLHAVCPFNHYISFRNYKQLKSTFHCFKSGCRETAVRLCTQQHKHCRSSSDGITSDTLPVAEALTEASVVIGCLSLWQSLKHITIGKQVQGIQH